MLPAAGPPPPRSAPSRALLPHLHLPPLPPVGNPSSVSPVSRLVLTQHGPLLWKEPRNSLLATSTPLSLPTFRDPGAYRTPSRVPGPRSPTSTRINSPRSVPAHPAPYMRQTDIGLLPVSTRAPQPPYQSPTSRFAGALATCGPALPPLARRLTQRPSTGHPGVAQKGGPLFLHQILPSPASPPLPRPCSPPRSMLSRCLTPARPATQDPLGFRPKPRAPPLGPPPLTPRHPMQPGHLLLPAGPPRALLAPPFLVPPAKVGTLREALRQVAQHAHVLRFVTALAAAATSTGLTLQGKLTWAPTAGASLRVTAAKRASFTRTPTAPAAGTSLPLPHTPLPPALRPWLVKSNA